MSGRRSRAHGQGSGPLDGVRAITLDFGNTLVAFPAGSFARVIERTAEVAASAVGVAAPEFIRVWDAERTRQLAEDVPEGREADLDVRTIRVLARLRGLPPPAEGVRWDDAALAPWCDPGEVEAILDAYAGAFVASTPVPRAIGPLLERLAGGRPVGIVSNWPLAIALERFLDAADWRRHLTAVIVSQRIGRIKPWPAIFLAAAPLLGEPSGAGILHVGDDLGADVAGARALGWRTAWLRTRPADSPLPLIPPAADVRPDLVLDDIGDLEAALGTGPASPR